jgi:hypothetical protein
MLYLCRGPDLVGLVVELLAGEIPFGRLTQAVRVAFSFLHRHRPSPQNRTASPPKSSAPKGAHPMCRQRRSFLQSATDTQAVKPPRQDGDQ